MNHADYCQQFVKKDSVVLDIGSGRGKFLCDMAARGFHVVGIEVNPAYIAAAREEAARAGVSPEIVKSGAERMPFHNDFFDFVNCSEVTEHVEDPVQACREIYRVLRPGGFCYITFQNRYCWYDYHYSMRGINWLPRSWATALLVWRRKEKQDAENGRQKLSTMHAFTYREASILLHGIGFAVRDIRREKIKKKFGWAAPLFLPPYWVLRTGYFNTFHILLQKPRGGEPRFPR